MLFFLLNIALIALVAGTIFSAISGSTIATTAMLGSLLLPEMLKRGYDRGMAMGPIMALCSMVVVTMRSPGFQGVPAKTRLRASVVL